MYNFILVIKYLRIILSYLQKNGRVIIHRSMPLLQSKYSFKEFFDDKSYIRDLYFDNLLITVLTNSYFKEIFNKTSFELHISEILWPDNTLPKKKSKSSNRSLSKIELAIIKLFFSIFSIEYIFNKTSWQKNKS